MTLALLITSCASSILESESIRTNTATVNSSSSNTSTAVYFSDKPPKQAYEEVGRVTASALFLDKGIEAAKKEVKKLGANAIVNVKCERRFNVDFLQDLYLIDGTAALWKVRNSYELKF